jgi:voltage-gated potassium channel
MKRRQEALERFERATELPLLLLALAMVPLLVLPLLLDLPSGLESAFVAADWLIWAVFAVEYAVRLALSQERWKFVRRQWADLLIVVLPFLRPLRILRSARALRVLKLARLGAALGRVSHDGKRLLVRHHFHYALLVIMMVIFGAASLALVVEDGSGGSIDSFGDALWWAVSTITTVGYGDTFPVTPAGRGIAAFLMVTGIALFGMLTANITTFFVERANQAGDEAGGGTADDGVSARLEELLRRMELLERSLSAARPSEKPVAD